MTPKEKQISFYNNYFIYKKIRNVDTRAVYNTMIGSSKFQDQLKSRDEEEFEKEMEEKEKEENDKDVVKNKAPKKLKRKLNRFFSC